MRLLQHTRNPAYAVHGQGKHLLPVPSYTLTPAAESFSVFGLAVELVDDQASFETYNAEDSLLALPYDGTCLVDRFDGRLLLEQADPPGNR